MHIDQLKYVQVVAKQLSFSKASEMLFISQSAISQSISKVEKELNIKIFHRTTKQVTLTKEGELAIKLIDDLLKVSDELKQLKDNVKKNDEINLAVVEGLFLPFMLHLLKNKVKNTQVRFTENDSISIIEDIQRGIIDIGIIPIYEENEHILKSLRVAPIIDISYYIFVSCASALAKKSRLTFKDIEKEQIILYDGSFLKWSFNTFSKENPHVDLLFTSTNQEFIREFTNKNQGITIDTVAEIIVNPHVQSGNVVAIPLEMNSPMNSYLGMVSDFNHTDQMVFNEFFKLVTEYIEVEINKASKFLPFK